MKFLAFDLGAESGRAVLGTLEKDRITLTELARFPNIPCQVEGHWHWDTPAFFGAMTDALARAVKEHPDLVSLGCDAWGVDFVTLGEGDRLLGEPYCYRDSRNDGMMEKAFERMPKEEIYRETGLQFMPFNSLYQFLAMSHGHGPVWKEVRQVLMMGDYFHFLFSGKKVTELSAASTTQACNPVERAWSKKLLAAFDIPPSTLAPIVPSGALLGPILPGIAQKTGASPKIQVIAPCSHDTGCAVAAAPADEGDPWAYLSSGTWSLLGAELAAPRISDQTARFGFTNELGVDGTVRFLKNINGLWLVQECRRAWEAEGKTCDYDTLTRLAEEARPFGPLLNPEDPRFLKAGEMPRKIADACRESGQTPPEGMGAMVRCALESLALQYRKVLEQLEEVLGYRIARLYVVGGGSRNGLLCQFTADAVNRPVVAGPVEATALGNCLIQAKALGQVRDRAHLRQIVRNSVELQRYKPRDAAAWEQHYARFLTLATRG